MDTMGYYGTYGQLLLGYAHCAEGSHSTLRTSVQEEPSPISFPEINLPSFIPRSLAHLTQPRISELGLEDSPDPAVGAVNSEHESPQVHTRAASALGKRGPESRPEQDADRPSPLKIHISRALYQRVCSSPAPKSKGQSSSSKGAKSKPVNNRNGGASRIGRDEDIRYDFVPDGAVGKGAVKGWRTDGDGPRATLTAGLWLTQLLAIPNNENQAQLLKLVQQLQNPAEDSSQPVCTSKTDPGSVIADLTAMESDAIAVDLFCMCKLIRLALNIDQ
ncbi:hypothetical protein B0H13DRAFT_1891327 [Mycena leptocephala]|nr:hypothetical protein B0H13DRAFT_1891327 [Mycena leptocephala]